MAVAQDDTKILGYHAINVGTMNVHELSKKPRGTPQHGEIPVLFPGQVAVDEQAQGLGIGSVLMHQVFSKACVVTDETALAEADPTFPSLNSGTGRKRLAGEPARKSGLLYRL